MTPTVSTHLPAGEFYRLRDRWLDYVAERADIHPTTRLVAIWIARRINPRTKDTWHQISTIARCLGLSTRTVIRAIRALENEGLLLVRRGGPRGKRAAVNRYEMVGPWTLQGDAHVTSTR